MPIFLLVRHGETDYNKKMRIAGRLPGVHINKKGLSQAQSLANNLSPLPIKAIYASPLERTLESAEPLAKALKIEITPSEGLLETDSGEWQDQSIKKLRRLKIWRSLQHSPSLFRFPGGESVLECQHRMVEVIESLRQTHAPQDLVACFSHSDPIKMVVAYYLGMPLDHFQRLGISTASITVLQVSDTGSHLFMLNHNPELAWDYFKPAAKHGKSSPRAAVTPA